MEDVKKKNKENYENTKAGLLSQGFAEREATISILKANLLALAYGIALGIPLFMLYMAVCGSYNVSGSLWLGVLFIISIPLHELIHGAVWAFFCRDKWKSVSFGVMWHALTPYCHCNEALRFHAYLLGALMPLFILGFGVFIVSLLLKSDILCSLSLLSILGAGGDITIALMLPKYRKAVIIDHPEKCGFVAFVK